MDTVLIAVTAISLALAVGMAILVARLLREDRQRSEARVAALAAMAGDPLPSRNEISLPQPVFHDLEPTRRTGHAAAAVAPATEELRDLELRPAHTDAGSRPELFASRQDPSPWGPRLAVIGSLTAAVAVAFLVVTLFGRHSNAAATPATLDHAVESAPLELVALRHVREGGTLTISGLVQNPKSGLPQARLIATAFVFGPDGTFLTSSRAPLDISRLAAGDESPFVVPVPVNGEVSRYRIGFRTEDGQVVAHVDKRTPDTFASKQEQP
jgi:hypothetical protein